LIYWKYQYLDFIDYEIVGSSGYGGNPYSKPVVFFTDAFTGEFLCGGEVSGGHFSRNLVSVFR
jgi:hypothetical protein